MHRQKIQPIVDVPLVMLMESAIGEECSSKYNGVEYRYSVLYENQPCYIYLPVSGRDALLRSQADSGDLVELLKQKRGGDYIYRAQVLGDANDEVLEPEPVRRPITPLPPRQIAAPPARAQQPRYTVPPVQTEPPPRAQPQYRAPPPRPEATDISPIAQQLAGCLRVSFDAFEETVAYAKSKGVELDYTSEDVRAFAISVYINHVNNGNRNR